MWQPTKIENYCGNTDIVSHLLKKIEQKQLPHGLLFSGDPGVGKTSLAKILSNYIKTEDGPAHIVHYNIANLTGIDNVREKIINDQKITPYTHRPTVFILDEVQRMSKPAQEALLIPAENVDAFKYKYYIACTTEISKIIPQLKDRFDCYYLKPLSTEEQEKLITVLQKEIGYFKNHEVFHFFNSTYTDNPRQIVKLYEKLKDCTDIEQAKNIAILESEEIAAIFITKEILFKGKRFDLRKYKGSWVELYKTMVSYASAVIYNKWIDLKDVYLDETWLRITDPELIKPKCYYLAQQLYKIGREL